MLRLPAVACFLLLALTLSPGCGSDPPAEQASSQVAPWWDTGGDGIDTDLAVVDASDTGTRADSPSDDHDTTADENDAIVETDTERDDPSENDGGDARVEVGEGDVPSDTPSDHNDTSSTDVGADVPAPLSPRILLVTPSSSADLAGHLRNMLEADSALDAPSVTSLTYTDPALMSLFYSVTNRAARLALFEQEWDYVVLLDSADTLSEPEVHFEGVRVFADLARTRGAVPILLVGHWVNGTSVPVVDGARCADTCGASDGSCFDGGQGAVGNGCQLGSDCADCGPRDEDASLGGLVNEVAYRVGNGTGSVVVPGSTAWAQAYPGSGEWTRIAAGTLYSTLTGRIASDLSHVPAGYTAGRWDEIGQVISDVLAAESARVQYEGAWEGAVTVVDEAPAGTFRFMISGTSSERGWRTAMRALLVREGVTYADEDIGRCNDYRTVDVTCMNLAVTAFDGKQFQILYARGYDVTADQIRTAGSQTGLQAQVYDRHYDSSANDGIAAVDDMLNRMRWAYHDAQANGLVYLPMHLNFAKLKIEFPTANLLSDGTHATNAVQAGIAAMSFVSRTGQSPNRSSLSGQTEAAVRLGEQTIRHWSTLSQTGVHVPDVPTSRPSLR